jgi:hypothetical protein
MPNLRRAPQRPTSSRALLQLNLSVESIPIKTLTMTTKTQDNIARKLAKIAEQLSGLANQLTASASPRPKPRATDRRRESNRDRHSPGYMRAYMRRWREARKAPKST